MWCDRDGVPVGWWVYDQASGVRYRIFLGVYRFYHHRQGIRIPEQGEEVNTNELLEIVAPIGYDPDLAGDEHREQCGVLRDILDKSTFDAVMVTSLAKQSTPYQALTSLVRRGYKSAIKEMEDEPSV